MLKDRKEILQKLKIEELNPMQQAAQSAFDTADNLIILSPTGTGKTLAFLLPILALLDDNLKFIQVLIVVPTRELALQIELVLREIGSGHKVNAIYGGRAGAKDKVDLQHSPAILIGTPGRIADHMERGSINSRHIQTLVLDEYDKSLEIGFEPEMREIISSLPSLKKRILTSATQSKSLPDFLSLNNPTYIDFLKNGVPQLRMEKYVTASVNRANALVELLEKLRNNAGIVFCNQKDTLDHISHILKDNSLKHVTFHGDMEQRDRERSLIKFRNGSVQLMLATDLAARGIDISALNFILHFEMPPREEEFIHRNGRTARMHNDGVAYLIQTKKDYLPEYVKNHTIDDFTEVPLTETNDMSTLFISGGRKDKISKGDIAGSFIKIAGLQNEEVGIIEIKQDCAFVAVNSNKVDDIIKTLDSTRMKKKKVRISLI